MARKVRPARETDVRVVLVDDHRAFSHALGTAIALTTDLTCVGCADSLEQAAPILDEQAPDVVVMDVNLPDGDGLDATSCVKRRLPRTRVVVLTSRADLEGIARAAAAGASAFLAKDCGFRELLDAIRLTGDGFMLVEHRTLTRALARHDIAGGVRRTE